MVLYASYFILNHPSISWCFQGYRLQRSCFLTSILFSELFLPLPFFIPSQTDISWNVLPNKMSQMLVNIMVHMATTLSSPGSELGFPNPLQTWAAACNFRRSLSDLWEQDVRHTAQTTVVCQSMGCFSHSLLVQLCAVHTYTQRMFRELMFQSGSVTFSATGWFPCSTHCCRSWWYTFVQEQILGNS